MPMPEPPPGERVSRSWIHLAGLLAATAVAGYLCYRVALPFLPAIAWAVALAVITDPIHRWITRLIPHRDWAAGVSLAVVLAVLVVPGVFIAVRLANEAQVASQVVREQVAEGRLRQTIEDIPQLARAVEWVRQHVNLEAEARRFLVYVGSATPSMLGGSAWAAIQFLMTAFILYFCYRDRAAMLAGVRKLVPLTPAETDRVFDRIEGSIHATIYGTFLASIVQAVTGGLLFWALGIPAALLWGVVIFVLGVLPLVGSGLVWGPVAVVMALDGQWVAAVILVVWGLAMVGPVGNAVYSWAAGSQMRLHPVPVLIAYAGGLAVFGLSGMVLGPAVLAVAVALVDVWKLRAGGGQLLESARPAGDDKAADHAAGNGSVSAGTGSAAGVG